MQRIKLVKGKLSVTKPASSSLNGGELKQTHPLQQARAGSEVISGFGTDSIDDAGSLRERAETVVQCVDPHVLVCPFNAGHATRACLPANAEDATRVCVTLQRCARHTSLFASPTLCTPHVLVCPPTLGTPLVFVCPFNAGHAPRACLPLLRWARHTFRRASLQADLRVRDVCGNLSEHCSRYGFGDESLDQSHVSGILKSVTHPPPPSSHPTRYFHVAAGSPTCSSTHSLIHSLAHPLTHSLAHPLTHSPALTRSPTHSLAHSLSRSHPLTQSTIHSVTHSPRSNRTEKSILCS
jgi:hypothetical protein